MNTWILIVWIAGGSASSTQVPSRIAEYTAQGDCQTAALEWTRVRGREAACIPGPKK